MSITYLIVTISQVVSSLYKILATLILAYYLLKNTFRREFKERASEA